MAATVRSSHAAQDWIVGLVAETADLAAAPLTGDHAVARRTSR